jgi:putative acetyltransferase
MTEKITIRKYKPEDARALVDIYFYTIHKVNIQDYTEEQVKAWAPVSSLELDGWQKKWTKLPPMVALQGAKIVGFTEFASNGHIDCFYVHHEFQRKGIGDTLINAIEQAALDNNVHKIYAEVSITAKPFFIKKGFKTVKEQVVIIRGFGLTNYVMEKGL